VGFADYVRDVIVLAYDEVSLLALHYVLDLGDLVAGTDQEQTGVAADLSVARQIQSHHFGAIDVSAFANESRKTRPRPSELQMNRRFDRFIQLSEAGLVVREALFAGIGHQPLLTRASHRREPR